MPKEKIICDLDKSILRLKLSSDSVKIGDFILNKEKKGRLNVNGYIFYNTIKDIPESSLKHELANIKKVFLLLRKNSKFFKLFFREKDIDYSLVLDYQNAGIVICQEIKGEYKKI